MREIRKIAASDEEIGSGRNVSGPLQIGNDWPGTFFRGDESGGIADILRHIANRIEAVGWPESASYLRELASKFMECQI